MNTGKIDPAFGANGRDRGFNRRGVDRSRLVACQA
jgi:hypothetical protein